MATSRQLCLLVMILRHFLTLCCLLILANPLWAGRTPTLRVAVSSSPLQILELNTEDYLVGVLAAEMPTNWPREVLKAQAVAARPTRSIASNIRRRAITIWRPPTRIRSIAFSRNTRRPS